MDGEGINQKIRFGYAKAASKLGQDYSLYRSPTAIDPLDSNNLIGTLKMVPTQAWNWMKGNRPGNAIWYILVDGREATYPLSAQESDYLVSDDLTFFVMSKEFQLPMQAVECNAVITIDRPDMPLPAGGAGYGAYTPGTAVTIYQNIPASILIKGYGKDAMSKLPTDTRQPSFMVQLPNLGNVDIRTGDIVTEVSDVGPVQERYAVSATEQTEFGWRLTVTQLVN